MLSAISPLLALVCGCAAVSALHTGAEPGARLYEFSDSGGPSGLGDWRSDITAASPQAAEELGFELPFFGAAYTNTRVSLHGYLEFSDPPDHYTYPLVFPVPGWPRQNDPAFIAPFLTKARVGKLRTQDRDGRQPGVYYRLERDLPRRTDPAGVRTRERVEEDVRSSGTGPSFTPRHAVVVTWKNVSFAGGIDSALYTTNTFQLVVATDEVHTYAIFNYADLQWTTHTEAGGDTATGEGGVPAYVGFNGGSGVGGYEHQPYSQNWAIRCLFPGGPCQDSNPGPHVFQIDTPCVKKGRLLQP